MRSYGRFAAGLTGIALGIASLGVATMWVATMWVASAAETGTKAYEQSIQQWRAERESRLKSPDNWLTVVGLHWLTEGDSLVGSDAKAQLRLPDSVPAKIGVLTLKAGKVTIRAEKGAGVTLNGAPIPAGPVALNSDAQPKYDTLAVGAVKFFVVEREIAGGKGVKIGIRVKDNNSAARRNFTGLQWYPVDATWNVKAEFVPYEKPKMLTFATEVGVQEHDESPGYAVFQRGGKEYRLDPVTEGDHLWFILRDGTSGKETYAASRFLYVPMPEKGLKVKGPLTIDFNRAENPPCVFTNYATCPLPPPQNRLSLAITAGEKMYGKQH
jgi:uncharacterized protein (DUF1684 family)